MKEKLFFEPCKVYWWPGYYIPVRNKFTCRLYKRHLSEYEKLEYEKTFGEKIILHTEFEEWRTKLHQKSKAKSGDDSIR